MPTKAKAEVKKSTTVAKPVKKEEKQRIRLKLKSYDHKVLDQSAAQILETVKRTGAKLAGPIPLPTERSLFSVLKSTFVHKNAQEQFALRIHKRLIDIFEPSQKTIDSLMSLNLPAGVDIEIKM
ncbi:MAG TPA: 30S ribosomal protein S10 [Patescibacteria group bacterium]|nr:30S ribosomal protein S10 [Patescibacteria group bacterium]